MRLEKPKERILEYLAVEDLVGKLDGPILCLVGPGVGRHRLLDPLLARPGELCPPGLGGVRDEAKSEVIGVPTLVPCQARSFSPLRRRVPVTRYLLMRLIR